MSDWPTFPSYDAHFVTPYLAVGAYPRPEHVPEIEAAGIRGILNVVGLSGRNAFDYVASLPAAIHWRHCGFWDGYFGPPERGANQVLCASFARLVTIEAALMLRDHGPLLLHCAGGSGRSGNVAAILVAAREGITIDEASARMQQHRAVIARFFREGFWKNTPDEELLGLARAVLSEPETPRPLYCARIRGDVDPAEPTFERIVR
jgi:hypothetical protein